MSETSSRIGSTADTISSSSTSSSSIDSTTINDLEQFISELTTAIITQYKPNGKVKTHNVGNTNFKTDFRFQTLNLQYKNIRSKFPLINENAINGVRILDYLLSDLYSPNVALLICFSIMVDCVELLQVYTKISIESYTFKTLSGRNKFFDVARGLFQFLLNISKETRQKIKHITRNLPHWKHEVYTPINYIASSISDLFDGHLDLTSNYESKSKDITDLQFTVGNNVDDKFENLGANKLILYEINSDEVVTSDQYLQLVSMFKFNSTFTKTTMKPCCDLVFQFNNHYVNSNKFKLFLKLSALKVVLYLNRKLVDNKLKGKNQDSPIIEELMTNIQAIVLKKYEIKITEYKANPNRLNEEPEENHDPITLPDDTVADDDADDADDDGNVNNGNVNSNDGNGNDHNKNVDENTKNNNIPQLNKQPLPPTDVPPTSNINLPANNVLPPSVNVPANNVNPPTSVNIPTKPTDSVLPPTSVNVPTKPTDNVPASNVLPPTLNVPANNVDPPTSVNVPTKPTQSAVSPPSDNVVNNNLLPTNVPMKTSSKSVNEPTTTNVVPEANLPISANKLQTKESESTSTLAESSNAEKTQNTDTPINDKPNVSNKNKRNHQAYMSSFDLNYKSHRSLPSEDPFTKSDLIDELDTVTPTVSNSDDDSVVKPLQTLDTLASKSKPTNVNSFHSMKVSELAARKNILDTSELLRKRKLNTIVEEDSIVDSKRKMITDVVENKEPVATSIITNSLISNNDNNSINNNISTNSDNNHIDSNLQSRSKLLIYTVLIVLLSIAVYSMLFYFALTTYSGKVSNYDDNSNNNST